MTDIVLYKLVSGEEIIAKKVNEQTDYVILENVRTLMIQPTGNGQMGIALIPWLAGSPDGEVHIDRSKIIGRPVQGVHKNLEDAYLQQTTGIQLAGAPGLSLK